MLTDPYLSLSNYPIILKIIILSLPLPTIFGGDWYIIVTLRNYLLFAKMPVWGRGQE